MKSGDNDQSGVFMTHLFCTTKLVAASRKSAQKIEPLGVQLDGIQYSSLYLGSFEQHIVVFDF